ncbi:hypothetical protein Cst_c02620 [Thermoclostridium stercorarium subsp. stercorarium DSM 8532]|uniref:Uncharacterized protein n=1 Tax=Thermoclostridium stercorarium (strain ATCC 35414 / DSM 8532 / NCIMB 11754) TaxID=1121335 RepID=L7VLC5_THES1|nr:hypothetical protein Cst_c02620 [Thermoclostridium stercorarium subsp. stercorarium DSM 8532]
MSGNALLNFFGIMVQYNCGIPAKSLLIFTKETGLVICKRKEK